ncbi:hypothetical protein [Deinococcus hohokamensis]|uniref:Uncharacterized protein n=1 Tax=Deinococcus hohokamensis TaxID=309883 RepID=A0ABV9IDT1_9DEIO
MQVAIKMVGTAYLAGSRAEASQNLRTILELLQEKGLGPEQFSFSDEPRHPFYRAPFPSPAYDEYLRTTEGQLFLFFFRKTRPAYEFSPGLVAEGLKHNSLALDLEHVAQHQLPGVFELATALADVTTPLFGGLGFPWEAETAEAEDFNSMLNAGSLDLFRNGPDSVAVRTWFGPAFAAQLDPSTLADLGLAVRPTAWSGLEVDLTLNPWTAPFERLASQKEAFNAHLNGLGLLGDYSRTLLRTPGRHWPAVQAQD